MVFHWYRHDTNQKFRDGQEALNGTLVDMRATYSNIPANYLTKRVFVGRLNEKITQLRQLTNPEVNDMAKGKGGSKQADFMKIGFLAFALIAFALIAFALIAFLGWRFLSGGFAIPKTESVIPQPAAAPENVPTGSKPAVYVAQQTNEFIEYLLKLIGHGYQLRLIRQIWASWVPLNSMTILKLSRRTLLKSCIR